jgi:hypothetical protein
VKTSRTRVFVIVTVVLAAAVVLYALFGRMPSVETASVTLPTPVAGGESQTSDSEEITLASVSPETVQAVIGTLNRAESYSRTVTVEDFWTGGSSSTELSVWADKQNERIRFDTGDDVKNILLNDGMLYIWYENTDGVYTAPAGGTNDADTWLNCLTYEDLLALPASAITDAGYQEYAGEPCVYAEYSSGSFGYRNIVYVSVNTGLLMGAETYDGETLVYRMTSGTPELAVPDSKMFLPPETGSGS